MYINVIVDVPIKESDKGFTYKVDRSHGPIIPGMRVIVPFGKKKVEGFVSEVDCSIGDATSALKIKKIMDVIDKEPILSKEMLELGRWMSARYFTRLATAWQSMLPASIKTTMQKKLYSTLAPETLDDLILTDNEKEILTFLAFEKQVNEIQLLEKFIDCESVIGDLKAKGYIQEVQLFAQRAKAKTIQYVFWNPSFNRYELEKAVKHAKKQKEITDILLADYDKDNAGIPIHQLEGELGNVRQAIKSLAEKGVVKVVETQMFRTIGSINNQSIRPTLTAEQQGCLTEIIKSIESEKQQTILLHGVTGSGKTEIYLKSIDEVVKQGKQAIVLVPEISLTPQMVERFKGFFGNQVAVMHSRLSHGERFDEWKRIQSGHATVVIGARSAIFAPVQRLGIIIIDEEHEGTYKQEETPRYDAREIAVFRSKWHQCPIVLGSATPSIESYYQASNHKYKLLQLKDRVFKQDMPVMQVIDMRKELSAGNYSIFSIELQQQLQRILESKQQAILFINRRGHSNFIMCRACGQVVYCPYCHITLTYHQREHNYQCHYCNYKKDKVQTCEKCKSEEIHLFGIGTEKIQEELMTIFPKAKILRMDVDTTKRKGSQEQILQQFHKGEADILIGTQMIAKGLDFPNVSLVGVISADVALNLPDFRAAERTFQLITQVGGRAGRHHLQGHVVVQSFNPEHYSIQHAIQYEYEEFFQREIQLRQQMGYPPFSRLVYITFSHTLEVATKEYAIRFAEQCKQSIQEKGFTIFLMGPNVAALSKIKNRFRYSLIVKYANWSQVYQLVRETLAKMDDVMYKSNVTVNIDVNPQMLL